MILMIRVLHVFGWLDRGGAEAVIMELYRHIDRSRVQFDFVVHTTRKCEYNDEIESLGGKIYSVPSFSTKTIVKYKKAWESLLSEHNEWHIIHGHVRSTASIYLRVAKRYGLFTIAHSHSISSGKGISALIKNSFQHAIKADYYFACSKKAGEWLFGKRVNGENFKILPNSIDTKKYRYNSFIREQVREELGCSDSIVIGHVGNFYDVKNHIFLLKVFYSFLQENRSAILLLVGDGTLKKSIEELAAEMGIENQVEFLGVRNDVYRILQAMDFFVFPSKFEGLGVAAIEAQATGLPMIISNTIPSEVVLIDELVTVMSINDCPEIWAKQIQDKLATTKRLDCSRIIAEKGYDISDTSIWMQSFYERVDKGIQH